MFDFHTVIVMINHVGRAYTMVNLKMSKATEIDVKCYVQMVKKVKIELHF